MSLANLFPLANHLWQSTVFILVVWLLTLVLRNDRAQIRYRLWLVASVKFLVPFSALAAIGRQFEWQSSTQIVRPEVTFVFDAIGQPFSQPELMAISPPVASVFNVTAVLPMLLLTVWFIGCAMHLLAWWIRWQRLSVIVRGAVQLSNGRELNILRRLERTVGIRRSVTLASSDSSLEPGIFGIVKPVLLWPRGISQRLSDHQVEALLTHELCHVRRGDNLAAAVHMVVEAVFWFHPLVWWLEKRLVDERERACDEAVIRLGSNPQLYAESILKTCEFYAESPLVCVSGVTGSDLKKRVETIMKGSGGERLEAWKRVVLAFVVVATIAAPIILGVMNGRPLRAQTASTDTNAAFEVASVKPNKSRDGNLDVGLAPGGRFTARNATLRDLVQLAYQLPSGRMRFDSQISGGPSWISSDRFDVVAKAEGMPAGLDASSIPAGAARPGETTAIELVRVMLRTLLMDRFKLTVHNEIRELPVYSLVMARSDGRFGPQLRKVEVDCAALRDGGRALSPLGIGQAPCGGFRGLESGRVIGHAVPSSMVAKFLEGSVGRVVTDRTGLTGTFDVDLQWTPDQLQRPAASEPPSIEPNGPSVFTALQEQLGLKLESTRGPVDVLVIDSAQRPTSDDAASISGPLPQLVTQSATQSSTPKASPTFEVVSIKANKSDDGRVMMQSPGGRLNITNAPLRLIIRLAYRVQDFQLVGGPTWLNSDYFDIAAKAEGNPTQEQLTVMLRALLAERFKLVLHDEKRDLPVYALVLARNDRALGPKIRQTALDCAALRKGPVPDPSIPSACGFRVGLGTMAAQGVGMNALAFTLSSSVGRVVLDRTGLSGDFDFDLLWTLDPLSGSASPAAPPIDPNAPSIFTALQEQLGLKLESTRGPVDVLVIDSVDQPTPD